MFNIPKSENEMKKWLSEGEAIRAEIKTDTDGMIKDFTKHAKTITPEMRGQMAALIESMANTIQSELIRLASHIRHGDA